MIAVVMPGWAKACDRSRISGQHFRDGDMPQIRLMAGCFQIEQAPGYR